jgi:RNA polymerase sigma-70 factor (family 1)
MFTFALMMDITVPDDEKTVLQKLQNGDKHSFAVMYNHYYSFVHARVLHLIHSTELAEDVTQEIFLKIWENREKLGAVQSFKSYLFITARNHTLNTLKSISRSENGLSEIVRYINTSHNSTEEEVLSNEYAKFIQQKLEELPPRTKEIFRLCREQSKTYNEVAAELGISRDAVKSRMMHAIKTLRDAAEKEIGLPLVVLLVFINP